MILRLRLALVLRFGLVWMIRAEVGSWIMYNVCECPQKYRNVRRCV